MRFSLYLLRRASVLFLAVLFGMTALVWVTQALRRLDLVTTQGQTLLTFVWMTLLTVPMMMVIVAPFAVIAAITVLLAQMHDDREIVAFEASGASPGRVVLPLVVFSVMVGILASFAAVTVVPAALHDLRDRTADIRADVLTTVVQPGQFVSLENNFMLHVSDRLSDGSLGGLFFFDDRDPGLSIAYTARRGSVVDVAGHGVLIMENGVMERRNKVTSATSFANFDRYGLDMSTLHPAVPSDALVYDPTEIPLTALIGELALEKDLKRHALLLTELNTRLSSVFYPLAATLVLYAFLGTPQTARRNRAWTLSAAVALACLVRVAAFGINNLVLSNTQLWPLMWVPAIAAIALSAGWLAGARALPFKAWRPAAPTPTPGDPA